MADRMSAEARSRVMSRIRGAGTGPERAARAALDAAGVAWVANVRGLPGRPDLAVLPARVAVFVNGCFWHRCPRCRPRMPGTNPGFWAKKFRANVRRDVMAAARLLDMGWAVVVLWECDMAAGLGGLLRLLANG